MKLVILLSFISAADILRLLLVSEQRAHLLFVPLRKDLWSLQVFTRQKNSAMQQLKMFTFTLCDFPCGTHYESSQMNSHLRASAMAVSASATTILPFMWAAG